MAIAAMAGSSRAGASDRDKIAAQRLNTQATAQLERSQQLQQVLFELQPFPRPARALPWLLAPALAVAFAAGVLLERLLP